MNDVLNIFANEKQEVLAAYATHHLSGIARFELRLAEDKNNIDKTMRVQHKYNKFMMHGVVCGVQSCDKRDANVFIVLPNKIAHYVRIDLENKKIISAPPPKKIIEEFVSSNFEEFAKFCDYLNN